MADVVTAESGSGVLSSIVALRIANHHARGLVIGFNPAQREATRSALIAETGAAHLPSLRSIRLNTSTRILV